MQSDSAISNSIKKSAKEFWHEHIKQWEQSNLSQQAYCSQAEVNYGTFVHWRCHFRNEAAQSKQKKFVPIKVMQSQHDAIHSIKVKLVTGTVICLPFSMDNARMAELIRMLEMQHA